METGTPSLSKVVPMGLFALSCVGLVLFLWVSFGRPIPFNTTLPETYLQLTPGSPSAKPVPDGGLLPRGADTLQAFPAFLTETKVAQWLAAPSYVKLENLPAFDCANAGGPVSAAPPLRPACWVPTLPGAPGPSQIPHILAATYPAK